MAVNLADPELELIDPTPNVHTLFIHFDKMFFWTKLASRAVVRWSKRMYSCAGVCSYEGRGGLCDIALSEPLLKLRPRKDLIETLLHEMIHAFLFVTGNDRDRDGHGPNFQSHMHRLNKAAGLNISIYHDFHDEVRLYQTHVWRCSGPCQHSKPYFGIVRRSMNRAPGPTDFWWSDHQRKCGGTFVKIKEPEKPPKKKAQKPQKPMGDITKFINNESKNGKVCTKSNGGGTLVVTKKNVVFNPKSPPAKPEIPKVQPFEGKGHSLSDKKTGDNVAETVRNAWLAKQTVVARVDVDEISRKVKEAWANKEVETKKLKRLSTETKAPPAKVKKIDDYFKTTATNLLKDVYGEDFGIYQKEDSKIVAIQNPEADQVECPICKAKVNNAEINNHIDECLNKEEIERITSEPTPSTSQVIIKTEPPDNKTQTLDKVSINQSDASIAEEQRCPCCNEIIKTSTEEHLDQCLAFFDNNTTVPVEGGSIETIVIEDDEEDAMDESLTMNATGTKTPCPVCLTMVEQDSMNEHLDTCLST